MAYCLARYDAKSRNAQRPHHPQGAPRRRCTRSRPLCRPHRQQPHCGRHSSSPWRRRRPAQSPTHPPQGAHLCLQPRAHCVPVQHRSRHHCSRTKTRPRQEESSGGLVCRMELDRRSSTPPRRRRTRGNHQPAAPLQPGRRGQRPGQRMVANGACTWAATQTIVTCIAHRRSKPPSSQP